MNALKRLMNALKRLMMMFPFLRNSIPEPVKLSRSKYHRKYSKTTGKSRIKKTCHRASTRYEGLFT